MSPQSADRTIDAEGGDAVSLTEGREIEGLSGLVIKNILSVNFRLARPKVQPGKGDKYLPKILQDLSNLLRKTQKDFHYDTLRLSADKIRDLSQTLVEFAEDVHNEIDIWNSLEQYNLEFFDTKLPLVPGSAEESAGHAPISKRRIQYLLWNQYQLFDPEQSR